MNKAGYCLEMTYTVDIINSVNLFPVNPTERGHES